jgi:Glycosyl hydrolase family 26
MVWGVPMLPSGNHSTFGPPADGASLARGAAGRYNRHFVLLAERLVAGGQGSSIIRLGWEFNGNWMSWAAKGQARNFVRYWRQIVDSMRSVPGANFQFEWNPDRGDLGVGNLANFYPGNAWVDIVGLDVYDCEWGHYPGPQAEWQHMVSEPYGLDWLASFGASHNKPLAFPEWGLGWTSGGMVGGGDNAYFVQQMAAWIATHDVVNAIGWERGSNPLPDPATAPAATAAFIAAFS